MFKKSEVKILSLLFSVEEPVNKKSIALSLETTEKTVFESVNSLLEKNLVKITDFKGRGKFYLLTEKGVAIAGLVGQMKKIMLEE